MDSDTLKILIGLFGAIGGWLFQYVRDKRKQHIENMQSMICTLARQVAAYHTLEGNYAKRVSENEANSKSQRTILSEMRDEVDDKGFARPNMTATEAKKIAEKYNCRN